METRIKVVRDTNGVDLFYPEYKGWFLWNSFIEYDYAWGTKHIVGFATLEAAKKFIDNKLTPVRFIKYP